MSLAKDNNVNFCFLITFVLVIQHSIEKYLVQWRSKVLRFSIVLVYNFDNLNITLQRPNFLAWQTSYDRGTSLNLA